MNTRIESKSEPLITEAKEDLDPYIPLLEYKAGNPIVDGREITPAEFKAKFNCDLFRGLVCRESALPLVNKLREKLRKTPLSRRREIATAAFQKYFETEPSTVKLGIHTLHPLFGYSTYFLKAAPDKTITSIYSGELVIEISDKSLTREELIDKMRKQIHISADDSFKACEYDMHLYKDFEIDGALYNIFIRAKDIGDESRLIMHQPETHEEVQCDPPVILANLETADMTVTHAVWDGLPLRFLETIRKVSADEEATLDYDEEDYFKARGNSPYYLEKSEGSPKYYIVKSDPKRGLVRTEYIVDRKPARSTHSEPSQPVADAMDLGQSKVSGLSPITNLEPTFDSSRPKTFPFWTSDSVVRAAARPTMPSLVGTQIKKF